MASLEGAPCRAAIYTIHILRLRLEGGSCTHGDQPIGWRKQAVGRIYHARCHGMTFNTARRSFGLACKVGQQAAGPGAGPRHFACGPPQRRRACLHVRRGASAARASEICRPGGEYGVQLQGSGAWEGWSGALQVHETSLCACTTVHVGMCQCRHRASSSRCRNNAYRALLQTMTLWCLWCSELWLTMHARTMPYACMHTRRAGTLSSRS